MIKCSTTWHADNHLFVYVIKGKVFFVSGHFGYIELPIPIYHPSHISGLKKMLSLLFFWVFNTKASFINWATYNQGEVTKILLLLIFWIVPLFILRKDRGAPCFYFHFLLRNEVVHIKNPIKSLFIYLFIYFLYSPFCNCAIMFWEVTTLFLFHQFVQYLLHCISFVSSNSSLYI